MPQNEKLVRRTKLEDDGSGTIVGEIDLREKLSGRKKKKTKLGKSSNARNIRRVNINDVRRKLSAMVNGRCDSIGSYEPHTYVKL